MKNKTFECPYLTEEDKEFLKYELKVYEKNFNMLLKLHKKHERLLKHTDDRRRTMTMQYIHHYVLIQAQIFFMLLR